MLGCGWRTLVVENPADLSLSESGICINQDERPSIPVDQLKNLIITSSKGSLSIALLNTLSRNNIGVIICNEKKLPACEVINSGDHSMYSGNLMKQISWDSERKAQLWKSIVEHKISNQMKLLSLLNINVPASLREYYGTVEPDDRTNREAMAAKVYFSALFGHKFRRHAPDNINSALNYGYTIVRSSIDRIIAAHGYNTALGINHCSVTNRFNLSCDIMEPFRPFIDRVVYENGGRELDWDYKKLLIELTQITCIDGGMEMSLETAMEQYFLYAVKYLAGKDCSSGEIDFG